MTTDSKLPKSGLCAHIILKTCVLQGGPGKGTQLNIGEFVLRQKSNIAVQQVDSRFLNA